MLPEDHLHPIAGKLNADTPLLGEPAVRDLAQAVVRVFLGPALDIPSRSMEGELHAAIPRAERASITPTGYLRVNTKSELSAAAWQLMHIPNFPCIRTDFAGVVITYSQFPLAAS